jgi:hypothetical protein
MASNPPSVTSMQIIVSHVSPCHHADHVLAALPPGAPPVSCCIRRKQGGQLPACSGAAGNSCPRKCGCMEAMGAPRQPGNFMLASGLTKHAAKQACHGTPSPSQPSPAQPSKPAVWQQLASSKGSCKQELTPRNLRHPPATALHQAVDVRHTHGVCWTQCLAGTNMNRCSP